MYITNQELIPFGCCYLTPEEYFCFNGLVIETIINLTVETPSYFLIYLPKSRTFFAFQIRHGFIYRRIIPPEKKDHRKVHKYQHLSTSIKHCSAKRYRDYVIYILWKEECLRRHWDIYDYKSYKKFRSSCHPRKNIMLNTDEWRRYCLWRRDCYLDRDRELVARCQGKACLTFLVSPNNITWLVDGYYVDSYSTNIPSIQVGYAGKYPSFLPITIRPFPKDKTSSCAGHPLSEEAITSSTVDYYPGHPLSEGAITSSLEEI